MTIFVWANYSWKFSYGSNSPKINTKKKQTSLFHWVQIRWILFIFQSIAFIIIFIHIEKSEFNWHRLRALFRSMFMYIKCTVVLIALIMQSLHISSYNIYCSNHIKSTSNTLIYNASNFIYIHQALHWLHKIILFYLLPSIFLLHNTNYTDNQKVFLLTDWLWS